MKLVGGITTREKEAKGRLSYPAQFMAGSDYCQPYTEAAK
jgi:hypothetical protein